LRPTNLAASHRPQATSLWREACSLIAINITYAQKTKPPHKNLHRVREAICVAQKMGEGLGRGKVL